MMRILLTVLLIDAGRTGQSVTAKASLRTSCNAESKFDITKNFSDISPSVRERLVRWAIYQAMPIEVAMNPVRRLFNWE